MDRNACMHAATETSWTLVWFWLSLAFFLAYLWSLRWLLCTLHHDAASLLQYKKNSQIQSRCWAVHAFIKWRDGTNDLGGLQSVCRCESSYWPGSMQALPPLVSLSPRPFLSGLCFSTHAPLCSWRAAAVILQILDGMRLKRDVGSQTAYCNIIKYSHCNSVHLTTSS